MKALVLGAGLMGRAIVYDLARSLSVEGVVVADLDRSLAEEVAKRYGNDRTSAEYVDVRDHERVVALMKGFDVVVSAVPLYHNEDLTRAAIEAKANLCDLGGSDEIVARQKALHEDARQAGITIVPNCGLAPGMANVIALHGLKRFDSVSELRIRVGGLPENPRPPLNYQLVFAVEGLIKEYTGKAKVLRGGQIQYLDALTEIEAIDFPRPLGRLEAFLTSGGASLLPEILQGRVQTLDYKTIRYPGHAEKMKTLLELGFGSAEPISIGGHLTTARELFGELLKRRLTFNDKDVVLVRVLLRGIRSGREARVAYTMIDRYDDTTSLTAMMRTTGFPTSIIAQMIISGEISAKGVYCPEECVPAEIFIAELCKRRIVIQEDWS